MYKVENSMYEIGLLLDHHFEKEKVESLGHRVYEISLLLHEYKRTIE
ncbi:hypothetical protein BGM26_20065 [Bacillus sp. FJAT-29790]|nr:hypothetical protein [Bacillus sp. FJAT-29790]MBU8881222.1 hypothetical protein [Bacillus sp. FJAT-29790]